MSESPHNYSMDEEKSLVEKEENSNFIWWMAILMSIEMLLMDFFHKHSEGFIQFANFIYNLFS